jgi:ribosomal protein S27E
MVNEKTETKAVFFEETGAVKCGYCGKTLLFLEKLTKKTSKTIDKKSYCAIINMKCGRCYRKNTLKF